MVRGEQGNFKPVYENPELIEIDQLDESVQGFSEPPPP